MFHVSKRVLLIVRTDAGSEDRKPLLGESQVPTTALCRTYFSITAKSCRLICCEIAPMVVPLVRHVTLVSGLHFQ